MRGFTLFAAGLLSDRRFTSPVVSPEANRCVESRCGERSARPAWRPWAGPASRASGPNIIWGLTDRNT